MRIHVTNLVSHAHLKTINSGLYFFFRKICTHSVRHHFACKQKVLHFNTLFFQLHSNKVEKCLYIWFVLPLHTLFLVNILQMSWNWCIWFRFTTQCFVLKMVDTGIKARVQRCLVDWLLVGLGPIVRLWDLGLWVVCPPWGSTKIQNSSAL